MFKNEWEIPSGDFGMAGMNIAQQVKELAKEQLPHFLEFFPFSPAYESNHFRDSNLVCIQLKNVVGQFPVVGVLKDADLISKANKLFEVSEYPDFKTTKSALRESDFTFDIFTYVGRVEGNKLSWPHILQNLISWLNNSVVPRIQELNMKRVTEAIPTPSNYDVLKLLNSVFVVESETFAKQGTAFHIKGIGIITCDHCIRDEETGKVANDLVLFRGRVLAKKVKPEIISTNKDIDIALLRVTEEGFLDEGLEFGKTDSLKQLDHIAVAGYPNYNFGDPGFFSPGQIVGFRNYNGIRHILVNIPIVSGNSGGPAFDKYSKVVGIAVTGADKFYKAHETEKHGLIPIETIQFLNLALK